MPIVKYRVDCTCGGEMALWEIDTMQDPDSDEYVIDLAMFGDMVIQCGLCHDKAYVPEILDLITDLDD